MRHIVSFGVAAFVVCFASCTNSQPPAATAPPADETHDHAAHAPDVPVPVATSTTHGEPEIRIDTGHGHPAHQHSADPPHAERVNQQPNSHAPASAHHGAESKPAQQQPHAAHGHAAPPATPAAQHDTTAASSTAPAAPPADNHDNNASALDIFRQRITPILKAKNPSSCSECHLSGVDLKDYIRDSQEDTFAALRDAGLIDTANPDGSKLLTFISRRPDRPSPVTEKVRQQEYDAFRAWINAAIGDPHLVAAKTDDTNLGPELPVEVIRHARRDRVLASFLDNVWAEVGRCAACHSPDRNQKQVQEHGEQVSWIKLRDPQGTLEYMLDADLIDLQAPEKSLLLLKPTNQVKHGGGVKLVVGDRTYKQFRRFIDDYAASAAGQYTSADQLPEPNTEVSQLTDAWLKITDVPEQFDKLLLQADIYAWDDAAATWSETRWATGDRQIFGAGKLWQQHLSLTAPRDSQRAAQLPNQQSLPPGRYLIKLYLDQQGKLQDNFNYELGDLEFIGQIEFTSRWPTGYGNMTIAKFPGQ